jgi:hypothetical protein
MQISLNIEVKYTLPFVNKRSEITKELFRLIGVYVQTLNTNISVTLLLDIIGTTGHAVAQLVEALQAGRSWVRLSMVSLKFLIDIFLPAALWTWS